MLSTNVMLKKIVNTLDKKYSYANMKSDLKKLKEAYGSILKVEVAGKSLDKEKFVLRYFR